MNVANLKITQRDIRHPIDVLFNFRRIACRGDFSYSEQKIAIIDTGDGNLWIRDGLHRCCGIYLAGRNICDSEFVIEKFTYEQMSQPNFGVKYYTPFDLRTEVRLEEFFVFKEKIDKLQTEEEKLLFIKNNPHLYKDKRMDHHESVATFCEYLRSK